MQYITSCGRVVEYAMTLKVRNTKTTIYSQFMWVCSSSNFEHNLFLKRTVSVILQNSTSDITNIEISVSPFAMKSTKFFISNVMHMRSKFNGCLIAWCWFNYYVPLPKLLFWQVVVWHPEPKASIYHMETSESDPN